MFLGLALAGFLLSGPANALAFECTKYSSVKPNQYSRLSTRPARVCSVEVVGSGGAGHADIVDSPDGVDTHGQARYVAEAGVTADLASFSTGKIDRTTQYGLAVYSNGVDVFVSWDD